MTSHEGQQKTIEKLQDILKSLKIDSKEILTDASRLMKYHNELSIEEYMKQFIQCGDAPLDGHISNREPLIIPIFNIGNSNWESSEVKPADFMTFL